MEWQMDEFPEEQVRPAAGTVEREPVPEGRHRFEIVRASEDGPKLKLALSRVVAGELDKAHGWVFVTANRQTDFGKRQVADLARGLGLGPAEWNATKVADLKGRQVEAEIVHRQTDRLWVNVDKFYAPDEVAEAPAPKPARKPAAAQQLAADDIPF